MSKRSEEGRSRYADAKLILDGNGETLNGVESRGTKSIVNTVLQGLRGMTLEEVDEQLNHFDDPPPRK